MSLQYILHARYQGSVPSRSSCTWGTQPRPKINTPPFNVPGSFAARFSALGRCGRSEGSFGNTIDVARQAGALYFSNADGVYLGGNLEGMSGGIETGNNNKQAVNRAVQFAGRDYCIIGNRIYVYNEATEQWDVSLSLTDKDGTKTNSTGMYPVLDNGTPKLIVVYETTDNTQGQIWQAAILNGNTNVWTKRGGSSIPIDDSAGGVVAEILHGTKLYFITGGGINNAIGRIGWYDWKVGLFGEVSYALDYNTTQPFAPIDLCTYNKRLYMVSHVFTGDITVYELTNSSLEIRYQIPIGPGVTNRSPSFIGDAEGRPMMFVDNVFDKNEPTLWVYHIAEGNKASPNEGGTQTGITFAALKPSGDAGGLQSAIDTSIRGGVAPGGIGIFRDEPFHINQDSEKTGSYGEKKLLSTVMRVFVDQSNRELGNAVNFFDNEPDTTSIVCATRYNTYCEGTSGSNGDGDFNCKGGGGDNLVLTYHAWQGSGNAPGHPAAFKEGTSWVYTRLAQRYGRHRALPHEKMGGGARHSPIDSNGFKVIDIIPRGVDLTLPSGLVRIRYSLVTTSGTPNGSVVNVKAHFDPNLHAPESRCALSGTSHGTVSNNTAINITADSGTIYTLDWDAASNGVDKTKAFNLNLTVSTTGLTGGVGVGAINDPTDLDGCVLWLDASDAATVETTVVDGSVINGWRDKSGAAVCSGVSQSTPGTKPTYLEAANNGLSGILFDGVNDYFFEPTSPLSSAGAATMLVVYEANTTGGGDRCIFSVSNDDVFTPVESGSPNSGVAQFDANHYSQYHNGANIRFEGYDLVRSTNGDAARTITSGSPINLAHLGVHKDVDWELSAAVDSGLFARTDFIADGEVDPSGLSNVSVGRFSGSQISGVYSGAGNYFSGRIYEIAVYDRDLQSGEVEGFRQYVFNKWNIG